MTFAKADVKDDLGAHITAGIKWLFEQIEQTDIVLEVKDKRDGYRVTTRRLPG